MKSLGQDASALPVKLEDDGRVTVEGEVIGRLDGFRFSVDPDATVADRKMLLAAGEKALPGILAQRAGQLLVAGLDQLELVEGEIRWDGQMLAKIEMPDDFAAARLTLARDISVLPDAPRSKLEEGLLAWLTARLEPLEPLRKLAEAARDPEAGSEARALLHTLIAGHGVVTRDNAGLQHLPKELRPYLRKLGVVFGALDIFAHALLKPAPRQLLHALDIDRRPLQEAMLPVIADAKHLPAGYRPAGTQAIRVDLAEKILRSAFDARAKATGEDKKPPARFAIDIALPISIGLEEANIARLLGAAGFRQFKAKELPEGAFGPPAPDMWNWRPRRPGDSQGHRRGASSHANNRGDNRGKGDKGRTDKRGKGPKGKPHKGAKHGSRDNRGKPKVDTGPARARGAFDGLADLLKG